MDDKNKYANQIHTEMKTPSKQGMLKKENLSIIIIINKPHQSICHTPITSSLFLSPSSRVFLTDFTV